ncbi:MAG: hypothetical protein FWC19_03130 [Treponema sp.]|nr:hypothetical protein [Treponema sp.]MCL2271783.1 hypothetical protein [Treponema sp.]
MKYFNFYPAGTQGRRDAERNAEFLKHAGCNLIKIMLACFLLFGCSLDEKEEQIDNSFIPQGVWADAFGGGYTITATSLNFDDGFEYTEFKGTIAAAVDFPKKSGVLIVKINSSETGITLNKYIGVYYKDYTSSHVFLANAIDESYAIIETAALDEAKKTFNVDNVDTHVTFWGSGYSK